jgi:hypothetical protein
MESVICTLIPSLKASVVSHYRLKCCSCFECSSAISIGRLSESNSFLTSTRSDLVFLVWGVRQDQLACLIWSNIFYFDRMILASVLCVLLGTASSNRLLWYLRVHMHTPGLFLVFIAGNRSRGSKSGHGNTNLSTYLGVPEGRVYSRRLVFVSVRTIKRHHHHTQTRWNVIFWILFLTRIHPPTLVWVTGQ